MNAKLLYFTAIDINENSNSGVVKKIASQCSSFEKKFGMGNVLFSAFSGEQYLVWLCNSCINNQISLKDACKLNKKLELLYIYKIVYKYIKENHITHLYYRSSGLTPASHHFFSSLVDLGVTIFVEIPTWPFWQEMFRQAFSLIRKNPVKGLLRIGSQVAYWIEAHRLKGLVKRIVTYSNVDKVWGIPAIGISNGYNFEDTSVVNYRQHDSINLVVSATLRENHGIDRIIKSVADYGGNERICLHIAGKGEAACQLKKLAESLGLLGNRVIFHGFLDTERLFDLYSICDIGVSALGFYRYGVQVYSPLKSKEYLAIGLPCIGTTGEVDIINSSVASYFFSVPNDDTPIEMCKIIDFVKELRNSGVTPAIIRKEAKSMFDWDVIMRPVINQFL